MFTIPKSKKQYLFLAIHLSIIAIIVFSVMTRMESFVRTILKFNLALSILIIFWQIYRRNFSFIKLVVLLATFPCALLLLNYLSTGEFSYQGYSRNLVNAYGIVIVTAALAFHHQARLAEWGTKLAKIIITSYTIIQLLAIEFHWGDFGTTKNPHFLALYSAICLCVSMFFYFQSRSKFRIFYIFQAIILLGIVMFTSSRPVWIGIILSSVFLIKYLNKDNWLKYLTGFLTIQILLIYSDLFQYRSRFYDLISNITVEERVVIWQDAWLLQKGSNLSSWLYGHGLNSFFNDFKAVSHYHNVQDFKSPHNLFLEMLYTTGIIGLSIVITFYYLLYRNWSFYRSKIAEKTHLASLILIIMTISLILNGINFPFASTSSIYPIAFISGLLLIFEVSSKINQNFNN